MNDNVYLTDTTQPITIWATSGAYADSSGLADLTITTPCFTVPSLAIPPNKSKGGDDMRYLYEVILVNPKNDEWFVDRFVAKTETSALMQAYDEYSEALDKIKFDDLKTSCRVLFEWKKEKSLKKAIETIKEAVE